MDAQKIPIAHQAWRDMVFLHWPVDAHVLRRIVPPTLTLDQRDGTAWISLLPFRALESRPVGLPSSIGFQFLECNLRTYVLHDGEPGIWFFSLDASSRLAVWGARALYGLPYVHARMTRDGRGQELAYTVTREGGGHLRVRAAATGPARPADPGSLDEWLLERYTLFVQHKSSLVRQRVVHQPYKVSPATLFELEQDLTGVAGVPVDPARVRAHVSPGVSVTFLKPDVFETAPLGSDLEERTPV